MYVTADLLCFNLAALIEKTIYDLVETQVLELPVPDSYGDFVAAEMNARSLRQGEGVEALFNAEATDDQFRQSVIAAFHHWQLETNTRRTPSEMEDYRRPCGE